MTWLVILGLAVATLAAAILLLKLPRKGWEAVAAALLFGLAGYGLQGSPSQAGAPGAPRNAAPAADPALVGERPQLGDGYGAGRDMLVISDALMRGGQYANAANLLAGALRRQPDNPDLWLGLGNALAAHAEGRLTPAARHAYERAIALAPEQPGGRFFLGLLLLRQGEIEEARQLWAEAVARGPEDAPWRAPLAAQLRALEAEPTAGRGP